MTEVELYPPALHLLGQDFHLCKSKSLNTYTKFMYKNNTIGTYLVFSKSSKIHIFQIRICT